jgi:tetraacyldisaccharide 4'-kinase
MKEKYSQKLFHLDQCHLLYTPSSMASLSTFLFIVGRPFSPVYSLLMRIRSRMFAAGLFKSQQMEVPVLSVGNLTMGGTGKTPIVRYIAQFLATHGYRPAIISRGYGGKACGRINVVSDGLNLLMDAQQAGDEPRLLAESLPNIPVLTGVVRSDPCRFAIDHFGSDILILDDGFQHLAVARDIDLVLFNASTLTENHRVFPGGELREPFSALARGDAFIITGFADELRPQTDRFCQFLRNNFPKTPIFFSKYIPSGCREGNNPSISSIDKLPSPLYGFCGIAKPDGFRRTLIDCGLQLKGFTALNDHQSYSPELLQKISNTAISAGAKALITTEKDMVKLRTTLLPLPLFDLVMTIEMSPSFGESIITMLSK